MVSISDIYSRFRQTAILTNYDNCELADKKAIQEQFLKNYLNSKITEYLLSPWEVTNGTVEELVEKLLGVLPKDLQKSVITQLTYYLLGVISDWQSYDIEWVKDDEASGFVANQNRRKLLLYVTKKDEDITTSFHDLYQFLKKYEPVLDEMPILVK